MSKRKIDPFTPNRPINDPERFIGRTDQVEEIIDSLFQISNSNPKHTIITGDRGIGKSSLLYQTKKLSTGSNTLSDILKINLGVEKHDFLVSWHDVDHDQTPEDLIIGLLRELESKFTQIFKSIKIELNIAEFVKFSKEDSSRKKSISELSVEFISRLKMVYEKTLPSKSGILLFIDELDRAKQKSGIATFFKITCEKLAREGMTKIAFICSGITGAIQELEEEHASILRTFRDIQLSRFSHDETKKIILTNLNKIHHSYDEQIFDKVYEITAGIPETIHIIGSEMVSVDTDNHITINDYDEAIKKIITDVWKNKFSSILQKAGGGKYQKILEAMANYDKKIVPLTYISKKIGQEQNQFSTNMATLTKRKVILKIDSGLYCFSDPLLKEYIGLFGVRSFEDEI